MLRDDGPPARVGARTIVGSVDDTLEREADQVATSILRAPTSATERATRDAPPRPVAALPVDAATDATIARLRGGGSPLSQSARQFFEPRLGCDLSAVRVHTGAEAAALAARLSARAFTFGHDIFFGRDTYQPATATGRHLLGHELTHVLQQRSAEAVVRRQEDLATDTPESLIAAHTGRFGLDASGLGASLRAMVIASDSRISDVATTVAAVDDFWRDNVAYALVEGMTDAQVDHLAGNTAGRALLLALRDAMTGGIQTPAESTQIDRINDRVSSLAVGTPAISLPPVVPAAAVILVGSPTDPKNNYDRSPYNFSNAAVQQVSRLQDAGFASAQITILYFADGFRRRGIENGKNVYATARASLEGTGASVVEVNSAAQIINHLNTGEIAPAREATTRDAKISQFIYFGHGGHDEFLLNWGWGEGSASLSSDQIASIDKDAFSAIGQSYLFTCHIAEGDESFMSIWASHLGQLTIGPQGSAAFNASYEASDLEKSINKRLPEWFLGMPYMNKVRIIDERP